MEGTGLILLAVADFGGAASGWFFADPGELICCETICEQSGMIFSLDEGDAICGEIFGCDKPGFAGTADAETFALADGVENGSFVLAELFAV